MCGDRGAAPSAAFVLCTRLQTLDSLQPLEHCFHHGFNSPELLPDAAGPVVEVCRANQGQQQLDALPLDAVPPSSLNGGKDLGILHMQNMQLP